MKQHLLLIPEKDDEERNALAQAWENLGGEVQRVAKFWLKPDVLNKKISIYGNDTFTLVLAQVLGVDLISPKDEIIARIGNRWTKRKIKTLPLPIYPKLTYPKFIKPVKPKAFRAQIYNSAADFKKEVHLIPEEEKIIVSEIIKIESEVRSFILDREIKDLACYEGKGDIKEARILAEDFLAHFPEDLPKTFVLDLGYNSTDGWFIIELNASWGSGLNSCQAEKVVECIRAASI